MRCDGTVRCPNCLSFQDLAGLEDTTSYNCWAREDNSVECLKCRKGFNVTAEHAGFRATEEFDLDTFMNSHKIKIPEEMRYWVRCFLGHFADEHFDFPVSYEQEMDTKELISCKSAYYFALQEWNKIIESLKETI